MLSMTEKPPVIAAVAGAIAKASFGVKHVGGDKWGVVGVVWAQQSLLNGRGRKGVSLAWNMLGMSDSSSGTGKSITVFFICPGPSPLAKGFFPPQLYNTMPSHCTRHAG